MIITIIIIKHYYHHLLTDPAGNMMEQEKFLQLQATAQCKDLTTQPKLR